MDAAKEPLVSAALDVAWSHWTGLGVRGSFRPPDTAVDPEALLCFTAGLVEVDPRLRDEVVDWWQAYRDHISQSRLASLVRRFDDPAWPAFSEMLRTGKRTGKSRLDRLDTPARSLLRLRAVFGANARAEILLDMLMHPSDEGMTALALSFLGYTKRNVALVLEQLVQGGVLRSSRQGNRTHYRLSDPDGLGKVLQPLPASARRWHISLPIVAAFVRLAIRVNGRDAVLQAVDAQRLMSQFRLQEIETAPAGGSATPGTYWPTLQRWLIEKFMTEPVDERRRIPGMIEGNWVSPSAREHRTTTRAGGGLLPRLGAVLDKSFTALDLVQAPIVQRPGEWSWVVLSTAAVQTYTHAAALERGEPWQFSSATRSFRVARAEPLPYDMIAKHYGAEATARARSDQPAVQVTVEPQ